MARGGIRLKDVEAAPDPCAQYCRVPPPALGTNRRSAVLSSLQAIALQDFCCSPGKQDPEVGRGGSLVPESGWVLAAQLFYIWWVLKSCSAFSLPNSQVLTDIPATGLVFQWESICFQRWSCLLCTAGIRMSGFLSDIHVRSVTYHISKITVWMHLKKISWLKWGYVFVFSLSCREHTFQKVVTITDCSPGLIFQHVQ